MRSPSWTASLLNVAALAWVTSTCGGGCSNSSSGGQSTKETWSFGLGDLAAEQSYSDSGGFGKISYIYDPTLPDWGHSSLSCGLHYVVLNPDVLATYPPSFQQFAVGHENGHHYLGHVGTDQGGCFSLIDEWLADAYGIRVAYSKLGISPAEDAVSFMASRGWPGDSTHADSSSRAQYMQSILDAAVLDPARVPAPPGFSNTLPRTGALVCSDLTNVGSFAFLNSTNLGPIPACLYGCIELLPGQYQVTLTDGSFNPYFTTIVTIDHGLTTYVPP